MKFKIFSFQNDIEIIEGKCSTLVIQNHKLYNNIVYSFNCYVNGEKGTEDIKLIAGDDIYDMSKSSVLVTDIITFNFNDRSIVNKLYAYIEKQFKLDDDSRNEINSTINRLKVNIENQLYEMPFEFSIKNDIDVKDCLKLLGVKYEYSYIATIKEKIYAIIDMVNVMNLTEIIIFVSIKKYLEREEWQELIKYILYKRVKVLFVEQGVDIDCVKGEVIYFIDNDYYEEIKTV